MEANKENIIETGLRSSSSTFSKVLAPLVNHINQKQENKENECETTCAHERAPLRTLNWSPVPGPSRTNQSTIKLKKLVKKRRVTIKEKDEQKKAQWDIFEDDPKSDDGKGTEEKHNEACAPSKNADKSAKRADSPKVPKLVTGRYYDLMKRGRKIKSIAMKCHNEELLELLPVAQPEQRRDHSRRRVVFRDFSYNPTPISCYLKDIYSKNIDKNYGPDHMSYLLEKERRGSVPAISSTTKACLLDWLMRVNGPEFPEIIQTTVWYLDTFLHSHAVQVDELQVLAAACYWISQKQHGIAYLASTLAYYSKDAFTAEALIAAEKMVLTKLNFPPQPVIPHDYITSICWGLEATSKDAIAMAALFLCMAGKMVNRVLCTEFPSVVAAASLKCAIVLLKKTEAMAQLRRSPVYQEALKKAKNMCGVCSALRLAVRMVVSSTYKYKAPERLYGQAPYYVAHKAIAWANKPAVQEKSDGVQDKMTE